MAQLKHVLTKSDEQIKIEPECRYRQVTIKLWGQGVILRNEVYGSEITTEKRHVLRYQDFIISRIDSRNGAFGLVPESLEGAIVSPDFPIFKLDVNQIHPKFLEWMSKTTWFIDLCKAASEGTTNRVRLKIDRFLESEIPLPLLDEQRRIVARIEELAARIEEARELRRRAMEELEAFAQTFLDREYSSSISCFGGLPLENVCNTITDGDHITPAFVDSGIKFIFVGNVSSGFLHFNGCKYVSPDYYDSIKPYRKPQKGDILYSAVGATLGIPAIVNSEDDFCFQRHVALIRPDPRKIATNFLWYMLRSRTIFKSAWSATTGSAQPTVPLRAIRALRIPVPPIEEQRRIIAYLDGLQSKLDALKRHQAETAAELNALLPSVLERAFRGEL